MSNNLIKEIQLLTKCFGEISSQWPEKVVTFCINNLNHITVGYAIPKRSNIEVINLKTFRLVKVIPSNLGTNSCKLIIKLRSHCTPSTL